MPTDVPTFSARCDRIGNVKSSSVTNPVHLDEKRQVSRSPTPRPCGSPSIASECIGDLATIDKTEQLTDVREVL